MQKSFLPKETRELKRVGKQHIYPLKRAIVQDASLLHTTHSQNPITTNAHVSAYSHSTFILRNQEVNALEREIEARSGIRYVPGENLVAKELVFPLQSPSRIDCIEREYFPQKHAFLQERHDKVQQPRPHFTPSPYPLFSPLYLSIGHLSQRFICRTGRALCTAGNSTSYYLGSFNMSKAAFASLKQTRGVIVNISATLHYYR